jgi:tryptophan synthase beta chain
LKQFELAEEYPDIIIGCTGGGSNFGGFAFPFLHKNFTEGKETRVIAVEPTACPTLTKGPYAFDYGDTAKSAPIVKMHTLGHGFVPEGIHAGGLRYHGMAPHISALAYNKNIEAVALSQVPTFEAAVQFAQTEGIIPAPETAHAVKAAIDEALKCKEEGTEKVIAFNFSGHGYLDLAAYDAYLQNELVDYAHPDELIAETTKDLPEIPEELLAE